MIRDVYIYIRYEIPEEDTKYLTPADKAKECIENILTDDTDLLDEFVKDYKITIEDGD